MTTLHDLKQALDSGETLIDTKGNRIDKRNDEYWYDPAIHEYGGAYPIRLDRITTPSDWRIRDQIGADYRDKDRQRVVAEFGEMKAEPTIMAVPIDEWNALQEELKSLRKRVG